MNEDWLAGFDECRRNNNDPRHDPNVLLDAAIRLEDGGNSNSPYIQGYAVALRLIAADLEDPIYPRVS